jgi:hypothetical protein
MTLKMSITRNQFSRNVSYKDKIPTYVHKLFLKVITILI